MHQSNPSSLIIAKNSRVVLLARIVDAASRPILPSQVLAIEYSVSERGICRSDYFAMRPKRPVSLVVTDVLSPTLANDSSWSVDVAGYNFRHQIAEGFVMPPTGGHIELRYVFSRADNMKSILRFGLKLD